MSGENLVSNSSNTKLKNCTWKHASRLSLKLVCSTLNKSAFFHLQGLKGNLTSYTCRGISPEKYDRQLQEGLTSEKCNILMASHNWEL